MEEVDAYLQEVICKKPSARSHLQEAICKKPSARSHLQEAIGRLVCALVVSVGLGSIAHAQPLPADQLCTDVDLTEFIPRATGHQWVTGTSGLILGDSLQNGSFEILLYDQAYALSNQPPTSPLIVIGTAVFHVMRPVTYMAPEPVHLFDDSESITFEADGQLDHDSIAFTLTTSAGTYYLSGMGGIVQMLFSSPAQIQVDRYIIAPTVEHGSAARAATEADQFVEVVENALNLPPMVPPPGPGGPGIIACADACQAAYDLAVAIADATYQTALSNCGPSLTGIATGCGVLGVLWMAVPPPGVNGAICCLIGSVPGAIIEYLDCKYDARRSYANSLNIAFLTWKSCMESCGYQIVEE